MQAYGQAFSRVYNLKWNRFAQSLAPQIQTLYESTWSERLKAIPGHPAKKWLLDLCCGNGILSRVFLGQDYRVIGLDLSEDMLQYARENNAEYVASGQARFIHGNAADFCFDEQFGLVVSTYDALNHLPSGEALQSCFKCIDKVLLPGGLFVFDLNTREGLRRWGDIGIEEDKEATIIHRGVYAPQDSKAWTQLSGFVRLENDLYQRFEETVYNTIFEMASVRQWLLDLGFQDVYFARAGDLFAPVKEPETLSRAFVIAHKPSPEGG